MSQYILVDTWNGEGYSESNATIIEADNIQKAVEVAVDRANEACQNNGTVRVFNGNTAQYTIGDDNGAYHILPYEGQYGVCIFPDVNNFTTLPSRESYLQAMNISLADKEVDADDREQAKEEEQGCIHTSAGCEIFMKLNAFDDLEFDEEGDGVEYEIWKSKITGMRYKVPISIERDFTNMEKV